jgi:hypothetical protein
MPILIHRSCRIDSEKGRTNVTTRHKYTVQADWSTVSPLGDTLVIDAAGGLDDRWVGAFEVVLGEQQRRSGARPWGAIDFEYARDAKSPFVLYVRKVKPAAQPLDLRRTVDDLVNATNTVAQVGTHVYELARELREPRVEAAPAGPRSSTPPPSAEAEAEDLRADAA